MRQAKFRSRWGGAVLLALRPGDTVPEPDEGLVDRLSRLGYGTALLPNRRRPGRAAPYPLFLGRVP